MFQRKLQNQTAGKEAGTGDEMDKRNVLKWRQGLAVKQEIYGRTL